jgi:hypothetical protein
MPAAAKRKPPIPPPAQATLAERIEDLRQECHAELDRLSELNRPPGISGPWRKLNWMRQGGGNPFDAYLIAVQELGL